MQISGYLPAPPLSSSQRQGDSKPATQNLPDARQGSSRRQTTEFIFEGESVDDATRSTYQRSAYTQIVDPANQRAISSYTEQQTIAPRKGRLLDIFI